MIRVDFTYSLRRIAALSLLGLCIAVWPIVGYASTIYASAPADVESPAQLGLLVTKAANVAQASVGETITYTYRVTNSGTTDFLAISAVDDRLGTVAGLSGALAAGDSRSATLSYVVQPTDLGSPLVNTVLVTGTTADLGNVAASASATVTIIDPTDLPGTEQPDQPSFELFMPSIRP